MSITVTDHTSRPGFEWLYPDLLTKTQLLTTLEQRYIKDVDLQKLDKDELVDLYNKYIIPLPQRKYRKNRRGRDMTVKQIRLSKKRRTVPTFADNQPPEKRRSTGKLLSSFDMPSTAVERLKPPPSCIDINKKKIKICSSVSSNSDNVIPVSSSLDNLTRTKSDQISTVKEIGSPKKVRLKNVKHEANRNEEIPENTEAKGDKCDKAKDNGQCSGAVEPMDTSESESGEPAAKKKIKIKKISWP